MPTENDNISAILQKLPVFAGLTEDEYGHIQKICQPARFNDGETLFVEGDSSPCMYVLLSGDVQLRTHNQGPIHSLNPGELFGEIGFISQQDRTATAIARARAVLLQINYDVFQNLVLREPRISFTIMRNIIMNLSNHITRMNKGDVLDFISTDNA
ncbi:MAG: Crp/Fnr family transcriptional regulator [Gammaproteobacteria bacterium]|nr:Crp/Fnr family transcriptional regulator [Gammaproteobacteria bacterium]MCF6259463.1 Crp/Fnr family transcriptional regulator [Gammaproteobacteria bacterium]